MNLEDLFLRLLLEREIPFKLFTTSDLLRVVGWHPRMASRLSRALHKLGYRQFRSVRGLLDADGRKMKHTNVWYLALAPSKDEAEFLETLHSPAGVRRAYLYERRKWHRKLADRFQQELDKESLKKKGREDSPNATFSALR